MASRTVNEAKDNRTNNKKAEETRPELYDEFKAEALEDRMELESKCLGG